MKVMLLICDVKFSPLCVIEKLRSWSHNAEVTKQKNISLWWMSCSSIKPRRNLNVGRCPTNDPKWCGLVGVLINEGLAGPTYAYVRR